MERRARDTNSLASKMNQKQILPSQQNSPLKPQNKSTLVQKLGQCKPGVLLTLCILALAPGIIGIPIQWIMGYNNPNLSVVQEWGEVSTSLDPDIRIEQVSGQPVIVNNDVITTFKITKANQNIKAYVDLTVETVDELTGEEDNEYQFFNMGFDCYEVWFSSVASFYKNIQSSDNFRVTPDLEVSMYDSLDDYYYYLDDQGKTVQEQRELYKRDNPSFYPTIEILNNGSESQSGIVSFLVTNPSDAKDYDRLHGTVNIIFKKDGQVVFGDLYDYSSPSAIQSKAFAYTPPIQLPQYDEVEVISLHS